MSQRPYRVLRHRDFRLLWLSQLVSLTGSQMQTVALHWHVYLLTRSPLALGALGLTRVVPIIALSLVGGVTADRFDRRRLMFRAQAVMLLGSAALAALTLAQRDSLALLYAGERAARRGHGLRRPGAPGADPAARPRGRAARGALAEPDDVPRRVHRRPGARGPDHRGRGAAGGRPARPGEGRRLRRHDAARAHLPAERGVVRRRAAGARADARVRAPSAATGSRPPRRCRPSATACASCSARRSWSGRPGSTSSPPSSRARSRCCRSSRTRCCTPARPATAGWSRRRRSAPSPARSTRRSATCRRGRGGSCSGPWRPTAARRSPTACRAASG